MTRSVFVLLASMLLLSLLAPAAVATQVQNESLANAIVAARSRNAALLRQYNWNSRTEVTENDKMMDLRIDLVSVTAGGQLQRTLLNDQPGQLPRGFLRRGIAQAQQRQAEQIAVGIASLVDQYTLPSGDKIAAFILQAQVQPITTPAGQSQLQVTGSGVVVPGDSLTIVFSGSTLMPVSVQISTTYNGDAVTISGTFVSMANGLNALQFLTAELPGKQLSVNIHNFDFVQQD